MLSLFKNKTIKQTKTVTIESNKIVDGFTNSIDVIISKSKRAKRISLNINKNSKVKVTIPYYTSFNTGEKFLNSKIDWVFKTLVKINNLVITSTSTNIDENTGYETGNYYFEITRVKDLQRVILVKKKLKLKDKTHLMISFPLSINILSKKSQGILIDVLEKFFRFEAKKIIPKKVAIFEKELSVRSSKVTIRNTKTRWGSCSSKNSLNFSLHLMRLPENLINYIILHELAHITFKNHQKEFWNLLDLYCEGEAKLLDKELKRYSTSI